MPRAVILHTNDKLRRMTEGKRWEVLEEREKGVRERETEEKEDGAGSRTSRKRKRSTQRIEQNRTEHTFQEQWYKALFQSSSLMAWCYTC